MTGSRSPAAVGTACYVCGDPTALAFVAHGHRVVSCGACGHRQAVIGEDPAGADFVSRTYSDEYFFGGGAGYADYLAEERLLVAHGRRYGNLLTRHVGRPGVVLDIGSAAGFVLRGLIDTGWTGLGVEPNPTMAAHARGHVGVDVRTGTLDDVAAPAAGNLADVVTMIQVIGHVSDPRAVMAQARGHTSDASHLLVETWDRNSLPARVLGRRWHEYSPPSVLHYFSLEGLVRVARQAGWRYATRGRPQKWLDGAHASSLLAHAAAGVPGVAALSRLIPASLPLPYPALDLAWVLFTRIDDADSGRATSRGRGAAR